MKNVLVLVCAVVIAISSLPAAHAAGGLQGALDIINGKKTDTSEDSSITLVSSEDFMFLFNLYSAYMDDGHVLSMDNVFDFEKMGNEIRYKTIFNDCEILSLLLTKDAEQVNSIVCTWAKNVRGADDYLNDFLQLLMEVLLACEMEPDSVSTLLTSFGEGYTFNSGDEGDITIDGIEVSYKVTAYSGVSFTIKRFE